MRNTQRLIDEQLARGKAVWDSCEATIRENGRLLEASLLAKLARKSRATQLLYSALASQTAL